MALSMAGDGNGWALQVPSIPNQSVILFSVQQKTGVKDIDHDQNVPSDPCE